MACPCACLPIAPNRRKPLRISALAGNALISNNIFVYKCGGWRALEGASSKLQRSLIGYSKIRKLEIIVILYYQIEARIHPAHEPIMLRNHNKPSEKEAPRSAKESAAARACIRLYK